MATAATTTTTIDERYEEVRALIYSQVNKFARQYGGDVDDLAGEAHVHFMQGDQTYTTGKTATGLDIDQPYHVVIKNHVWYGLFDAMRTRVRRHNMAAMQQAGETDVTLADRHEFNADIMAIDSSDDARLVLGLVLDPPAELHREAQAKGGEPRNVRSTVRAYLTRQGWTPERINTTFEEIRKELV